jgi:hypothetical protein
VRGQIAAYVGERDEQRARADASDALAAARLEERALAEAALQVVEKQLKVEVQARESVERRLAEEVKAQVPLKAQLAQLADVQAEAARFQMAAQKASAIAAKGREIAAAEASLQREDAAAQARLATLRQEQHDLERGLRGPCVSEDLHLTRLQRLPIKIQRTRRSQGWSLPMSDGREELPRLIPNVGATAGRDKRQPQVQRMTSAQLVRKILLHRIDEARKKTRVAE